jgi:hypothetical protein
MELELKNFYNKEIESGKSSDTAIKDAIKKAIETYVHLHRGQSPQNLSEQISEAVYKELSALGQKDEALLKYAFETLIESIQKPKEKEIERLIVEIDRLQRHLNTEEEELQRALRAIFTGIERCSNRVDPDEQALWQEALENTELEHVDGLGILNETVEAALIAAYEEAEDIESAIREVIRQITHKALSEGLLSSARVKATLTTILTKASELAEATPNSAKDIIHGTVYGINDALISTVKQLKEQLNFAPDEIRGNHITNWEDLIKMLSRSDELYKEIIDEVASKNSSFVSEILTQSANVLGDNFAELKRISNETIDLAKRKLSLLAKEAVIIGAELKEQLTSEAKRLGTKAWKRAIKMAEAYKNKI